MFLLGLPRGTRRWSLLSVYLDARIAWRETRLGIIPIPAAAAAGMGRTDLTYCFVMVQTTPDFGVV